MRSVRQEVAGAQIERRQQRGLVVLIAWALVLGFVVAAFASVAAYRGSVALGGGFPQLLQNLLATKKPVALIAMGNPYLLRNFPEVAAYLTTYSTVPPSEVSAVKALFGEIGIHGRSPVTIPGIADRGAGLDRPIITSHQR